MIFVSDRTKTAERDHVSIGSFWVYDVKMSVRCISLVMKNHKLSLLGTSSFKSLKHLTF